MSHSLKSRNMELVFLTSFFWCQPIPSRTSSSTFGSKWLREEDMLQSEQFVVSSPRKKIDEGTSSMPSIGSCCVIVLFNVILEQLVLFSCHDDFVLILQVTASHMTWWRRIENQCFFSFRNHTISILVSSPLFFLVWPNYEIITVLWIFL